MMISSSEVQSTDETATNKLLVDCVGAGSKQEDKGIIVPSCAMAHERLYVLSI